MMIRNLSRLSSRVHSQHVVKRSLAAVASSGSTNPLTVGPFRVFDREAKTMQKDRSATINGGERSRTVDYVREEVADRLLERLLVCHPISIRTPN
jgi:NADH dehydrogenase [ubiquinone] 1 alpha subcomplex assembly factor 5